MTNRQGPDPKAKQIAVSAPNSMPDMLARSALAKFGIADSDVKLAASVATMIVTRRLSAVLSTPPLCQMNISRSRQRTSIFGRRSGATEFPGVAWYPVPGSSLNEAMTPSISSPPR